MISQSLCLHAMEKAALNARTLQLASFNTRLLNTRQKSSHRNLVTQVDISCQKRIVETITDVLVGAGIPCRDIGFVGEENLNSPHRHTFIIDPLDGTNNYASGFEYFGTSIAYAYDDAIIAGIVSHPLKDTVYYAYQGHGAWKKKGRLPALQMRMEQTALDQSLISTSVSSQPRYLDTLISIVRQLTPLARSIRIMGGGSLDLTLLADPDNAIHGVIYPHLYLWDIAAAWLIVREAGGVFSSLKGFPFIPSLTHHDITEGIIAGHPSIVDTIKTMIST